MSSLSPALRSMRILLAAITCLIAFSDTVQSQQQPTRRTRRAKAVRDADLPYPPALPGNATRVRDASPQFLIPSSELLQGVGVAQTVPTVDFLFYPEQKYPGKPWSNWGDGCFADGKYYSAIGDHYAIGRGEQAHGTGTAFLYEYDPQTQELKSLVNISKQLQLPAGHYTPGKVHSRVDMGRDGWLYYATHRGSPRAANDANHYKGDWILRTQPSTGKTQVVARGLIPKHSIPNSVLDAERMIFYGATAAGPDAAEQEIQFFAYDLQKQQLIHSGSNGPARYMILARSTGRVYFVPGAADGELMRFDPQSPDQLVSTGQMMGVRAATEETADGFVYAVSKGQGAADAAVWQFNTRTEKAQQIGTVRVGNQAYVASIDVDPTGRYLYYVPGAHGGGHNDGSPVVQYDVKTNRKKVIAFLHPFYQDKYGFTLKGTYSTAVSADGDQLFATWNVSRGTRAWDCCGLSVVYIPKSERVP